MKVGVRAKLAEPPARGPDKSRALRAIDGKHAEAAAADVSSGSAAFGVRAADDFSLESVPVEAPRSGRLRLLPGGRAVLRADSRAGASGETGVLDRDERSRSTDSATRDADAADHEPASETALESEPASESTTSESIEPAASETSDAAAPGAEQAPVAVETPAASDVAAAAPGLTPAISPAPVEALAPAQPASAVARSPSDVARELEALPPSAQADAYGGLGSALDAALGAASTEAASVVPELSAALPGGAEPVVVN
ncbi:MAG TPA: hypothetical protein VNN80_26030, partial [Polyangiaceae bacterium]|nr:hypothetical protein [Polyangiaceae bacterium]